MPAPRSSAPRQVAPTCDDFGDLDQVRRYEIAMRAHRAQAEAWRISPLDRRLCGGYRVQGTLRSTYLVDLLTPVEGTCTCPDFLGNQLGTCKHLEAVKRSISGRRSPPRENTGPVIGVDARGALRLTHEGRWSKRQLEEHHLHFVGEELRVIPGEEPIAGFSRGGGRVLHAVVPALQRIEFRRSLEARRRAVEEAFRSSSWGRDLLRERLFPYQELGLQHLVTRGRAILADDMGLGKTVQAIAAAELLRARGEVRRVLIVTVASLKDQWAKEISRFTGRTATVVWGGAAERGRALRSDTPYKILNYEQTWRELNLLQALDADLVILDEAQRAKNFRTKTALTLRSIPSKFLFVLTGTPVENRLDDLYALLQLVDPSVLGPLWRFNLDFHLRNDNGRVVGSKNLSGLRERVQPVVMRRRKEEVLAQLPPLTEQTRYVPLTPEQKALELGYRSDAAMLASRARKRPLTLDEQRRLMMFLLKARQACNAAELCDPKRKVKVSPKLDELEALLGEILERGDAKVLVFSEWTEMLRLAAARLDRMGVGHATLSGEVPAKKRGALLEEFRRSPEIQVLLSTDAGGVGLNLQVASYVIHLDLPWNPGKLDQRTARAHRMGQTRGVSVIYLCAEEGIERGIEATLGAKRTLRSAALDPTSKVEDVDLPGFSELMLTLQQVLDASGGAPSSPPPPSSLPTEPPPAAQAGESEVVEAAGAGGRVSSSRADDRLRLARVVLDAGFVGEAVVAAYQALAAAIGARLPEPATTHPTLVAAIYRELLPSGRLPGEAHLALSRLHDLTLLEPAGLAVPAELATKAVEEAQLWVNRLGPPEIGD